MRQPEREINCSRLAGRLAPALAPLASKLRLNSESGFFASQASSPVNMIADCGCAANNKKNRRSDYSARP
jgi:hypothetical protein